MTGTIISQSYLDGITLTNAGSYNPVSILAGVTVTIAAGPAIQASGTIDWTISNAGTALGGGTSAGSYGIAMQGGGTVTNLAGGMLGGAYGGVAMHGIGTVLNEGSIASTVATAGAAVVLAGGGYVENQSGGVITGHDTGIALQEAGSVTNAGTLRGLTGSGALLAGGGGVSNGTASSILGYSTGVSLGGVGTVVNQGSIGAGQTAGAGYTYSPPATRPRCWPPACC